MKALNKNHSVQNLLYTILVALGVFFGTALATDSVPDTASFYRVHQSTFGSEWYQYDNTVDIIELTDGSYVAAGHVFQYYNHANGVRSNIIKYNKNGAIHWNKAFGSPEWASNFSFNRVIELNNGDLLVLGDTNEDTGVAISGSRAMFAVRLDSLGNIKWQKVYGRTSALKTYISPLDAREDVNGNITIVGRYSNAWNYTDLGFSIFIELALDESGNLLSHALITDDTDSTHSDASGRVLIEKTADDGYLIVTDYFFSGFAWTGVTTKLDALGNKEWGHYLVPKDSNGNSVATGNMTSIELDDGYLLVSIVHIDGISTLFAYKVDFQGSLLWNKLISNITLNGNISSVDSSGNIHIAQTNEVLLAVTNGFSTIDFTVLNINPENGDVKWVKSYGNKVSFDNSSGGNRPFRILPTQDDYIVGAGSNFLTKITGNGDVPFDSDDFMMQERTDYIVQVAEVQKVDAGFWHKFVPESGLTEKAVDYLLPGSAIDLSVVSDTTEGIATPSDFSFILDTDMLTLQWSEIENAIGYTLFWGTQSATYPDSMDMGDIFQLGPFDVSGLPRGNYYLAIKAYDEAYTSTPSNEILVNLVTPAGPSNFRYTLDTDTLTLQWEEVKNATGYKLFWGSQSTNYSDSMDMGNIPQLGPFDVSALPRGKYYLAITFYDDNGASRFSNEIVVTLKSPGDSQELSVDSYVDLVMGLSNETLNGGLTEQLEPVMLAILGQPSSSCPAVDMNFDLSSSDSLDSLLQALPKPSVISVDYGTGCTTDTGELMAGQTTLTVNDLIIDESTSNLSATFSMQVDDLSKNGTIISNGSMSGTLSANIQDSTATGHIDFTDFLLPNGLLISGGIDLQALENSDILIDMAISTDSNMNAQLQLIISSAEDDSFTVNTKAPGAIDQYTVSLDSIIYNPALCEAYPIAGSAIFSTDNETQTVRFNDRCDGTYILE